ncbi:MAG: NAD(P)H-dependent oxidoreductase [Chitinophagaceae bacterium]|nr:NAD(P)H-dependent oxidoreductase [Chitinophagaceae bacterium]
MNSTIRLVGISGSLRKKSYNTILLNAVKELLPAEVTLELLSIDGLPLYNGDFDIPDVTQRPAAVVDFRNGLEHADGLIIVSPEYNYSIPGGLKNAIDWASRGTDSPIIQKPVALMGVTPGLWGTVRMQLAFQPVFQALGMQQTKPEILVSQAKAKFDTEGKLTDEDTRKLIIKQLLSLKEQIIKMRS